jgi:hypothetical protein
MSLMDEPTLAEIEAEMNDPDAWGEPEDAPPPRPRSERRQRAAVVSVRLSETELTTVQDYASSRGLSLSGALRTAALEAAAVQARVIYPSRWHGARAVANDSDATVTVGVTIDSNFAFAR